MPNINLRKTTDDINNVADGSLLLKSVGNTVAFTGTTARQIAEWSGTGWAAVTAPLYAVGTNARSAQIPDNTAVGGNARGGGSADFQETRSASAQVASGLRSVISGGQFNTASGDGSAVCGGSSNIASGQFSWVSGGQAGSTRGIFAAHAWSGSLRSTIGDNQHWGIVLQGSTTNATPTILTSDRAVPSATNVMVLPNNGSWSGIIDVQARGTNGNTASWLFKLRAKRGANAAATVISRLVIIDSDTVELPGAVCTIIADTTRGSWEIQVTGLAGTTIDWIADVTVGSLTHR